MENIKTIHLEPADIFLTRGNSLLSKAIRFFSTSIGESRAKVNHVGLVATKGSVYDCMVIEALSKVKKRFPPPSSNVGVPS